MEFDKEEMEPMMMPCSFTVEMEENCPARGQVPVISVEVLEPSVIYEDKDGKNQRNLPIRIL